jgi:hypothetical protein
LGLCLAAAACSALSPDFGSAVAISITGPLTPSVEEGDTLRLSAQALDQGGAVLSDTVAWAVVDTGAIGFTIDTATGLITALTPDTAHVQAHVGSLRSNPIQVIVTPMPDTVFATTARVVVALTDVESQPLTTTVQDLTTIPGSPQYLGGKTVSYVIVDPTLATALYLEAHSTTTDTLPGTDPARESTLSVGNGQAVLFVHKVAGQALPDSATVEATGLTARGVPVPGSPVRFTVVFLKS